MSIPEIDVTGIDWVDYQLALMIKWRNNGSMPMAAGHAITAAMELIDETIKGNTSPNQLQAFKDFMDREWWTALIE